MNIQEPARTKRPLTDRIYHDDNAARAHLEALLWPDGPVCPRCGVMDDRITKLKGKSTRPGVYKCKDCRKPFTVTVGTIFERSHVPLCKWVMASHFMANAKKGMSAKQLQRHIGTNYETAWFLFHRLRELTPSPAASGPLGGAGKVVEIDETYIGGKARNKAFRPTPKKMAVLSLIERGGDVRSFHVANVTAKTLRPIIVKNASRKSHLMTDEAHVYTYLGREFAAHDTLHHGGDEYVRGTAYTNTIESFFALLKRGVYGQFHSVSEAHLFRYLREFDWRHNGRHLTDAARADALLANAKGKRLFYHQPSQTAH